MGVPGCVKCLGERANARRTDNIKGTRMKRIAAKVSDIPLSVLDTIQSAHRAGEQV